LKGVLLKSDNILKVLLSIFLILFVNNYSYCEIHTATITVDNTLSDHVITSNIEWLSDESTTWTIEQVPAKLFKPLTSTGLGRQQGNIWVRFSLHNKSAKLVSAVLNNGDRHVDEIELYVLDSQGVLINHDVNGVEYAFSDRTLQSTSIVFPVEIDAGENLQVYLKVRSQFIIQITPSLKSYAQFYNREQTSSLVAYTFYGVIIGLMLYNALIWISVREVEFALFVMFVALWGVTTMANDGLIYRIWPYELFGRYPPWLFYVLCGTAMTSTSVFTIVYLRLKEHSALYLWAQYILAFFGVVIAIGPLLFSLSTVMILGLALITMISLVNIITGLLMVRSGSRHAVEYTLAFGIMFIVYVFAGVSVYGLLDNYSDSQFYVRLGLLFPVLLFAVGIGNNMNRSKQDAVELQREADAANYAAAFKSRFLATMSHEIRTPMNGVLGMIQMLMGTNLNQRQKQFTEIIDSSGRALLSVINDILDISKLESGETLLEKSTIKLEDFLDECIDVFSALNRLGKLQFNVFIAADTPAYFVGDFSRIRQIVINLLGNAFKFTDHGSVSISVSIEEKNKDLSLVFAIHDTGVGIDAKALKGLFSPFTQADESTSRKFGGTGLGLAICKELSDAMDGDIWVESVLKEGSTFYFQLPYIAVELKIDTEEVLITPALNGKKVLVVDDDPAFFRTIDMTLKSWGMTVYCASSGAAVLPMLLETTIDIMLLDNQLADGKGLSLVSKVRDLPGYHTLPIVSISAGYDIPADELLTELGIASHLIKPIKFRSLRKIVLEHLSSDIELNEIDRGLDLPGITVLVVEDNIINQIVIKNMLLTLGIVPQVCDDGQQGLDRFVEGLQPGNKPFDLVLMDCEMPVLDGYATTRGIREYESSQQSGSHVPIIGVSAHAMEEHKNRALQAGMNLYLTKPIQMEDLRNAIVSLR